MSKIIWVTRDEYFEMERNNKPVHNILTGKNEYPYDMKLFTYHGKAEEDEQARISSNAEHESKWGGKFERELCSQHNYKNFIHNLQVDGIDFRVTYEQCHADILPKPITHVYVYYGEFNDNWKPTGKREVIVKNKKTAR